jgi:cbb3-type cytochrome c oxidase subunit III
MRPKEEYTRLIVTSLVLTVAIFIAFQVYLVREPGRIAAVEARDKTLAVEGGQALFKKNCALCHGDNGEGSSGPALKDKTFLNTTDDDTFFNVISAGVPSTEMPAWNEAHGGPMTDEEVKQVVAFMRDWQATATDIRAAPPNGDSDRGQTLFTNVCAACHGGKGEGTDKAIALNDPQKLKEFDDAWYRETITKGRPDKGMPTWGTVLAPQQISDLLALVDQWRKNAMP